MRVDTDTLIVGAGPAGLAVGASLRRAGVAFTILERSQHVGDAWRRHYERLQLHTPKAHSALPYHPFPHDYPRYPSREQVVAYLESYAAGHGLKPELGREVRRVTRAADGAWEVDTNAGPRRARRVVVATGLSRVPRVPSWPGRDTFPGPVLHSSSYRTGRTYRGSRVLVVGFGNSGAEIALDLAEQGAACTVAVRGPVNVIPRDLLGIPIIVWGLMSSALPPGVADRMNALTLRLAVGSLRSAGLAKRDDGPMVEIVKHRQTPVIDVGTIARMRRGEIAVRSGVVAFDGGEVRFADGARERFDVVVLATGYTTGLPTLLPEERDVLDVQGLPHVSGAESAAPGLYFCGFGVARTGLLREIGVEALAIARDVAGRSGRRLAGD